MIDKRCSVGLALFALWFAPPSFGFQTENVESREAAKLLTAANGLLKKLPDDQSNRKRNIWRQLNGMLIRNGQYDEAELNANEMDERPGQELFQRIRREKTRKLANSIGSRDLDPDAHLQKMDRLKRLTRRSIDETLPDISDSIDELIEQGRIETATEIIDNIPGDMHAYRYKAGTISNSQYKMSYLTKIAEHHVRKGDERLAEDVFDRFEPGITRDRSRLIVLIRCLRNGHEDELIAESMLKKIEYRFWKYWGAFRLGAYFLQEKNLKKAIQYAEIMEEFHDDSNRGYHRYQAKLLAHISQLTFDSGKNAYKWIRQAGELAGDVPEVQMDLICVLALKGDLDQVSKSPIASMNSIRILLDLKNERRDNYTPFRHVDDQRRVATAIEIAERLEHPLLRANAICIVVEEVAKSDFDKAKQMVESAYESAKASVDPLAQDQGIKISRSDVLQQVAIRFAQIGELVQAMEAIALIPETPEVQHGFFAGKTTRRKRALQQMSGYMRISDAAFKQTDAPQVFAVVDELENYNSNQASIILNVLVRKFIELGKWNSAEKAYLQLRDKFGSSLPMPYAIAEQVAKTEDLERLRYWFDLCDEEKKLVFLNRFCLHFNVHSSIFPKSRTIIEVESLLDECSGRDNSSSEQIDIFLVLGFWANGFEHRTRELITEIESKSDSQQVLASLVTKASRNDFPELAVLLMSKMDNQIRSATYLYNGFYRSSDRVDKLFQDKQWLESQPPMIQVSLMLNRAKRLLNEKEKAARR